jgi:hypothetical protein
MPWGGSASSRSGRIREGGAVAVNSLGRVYGSSATRLEYRLGNIARALTPHVRHTPEHVSLPHAKLQVWLAIEAAVLHARVLAITNCLDLLLQDCLVCEGRR